MNSKNTASSILLIVFCLLAAGSGEQTKEERIAMNCSSSGDIMAFVMSHEFVKKRLKSPSTAEFPSITSSGVFTSYLGDCVHMITGYVDAQNSFGAVIRNEYSVKVRYNGDDDLWYLEELDM